MIKILLLIGLLSATIYADITPKIYFELEIKAQELTIEGQKKRLVCMQNSCPMSEQYQIDGDYQTKIFDIYEKEGTTPSKIAAYYTHNYKAIDAYLENDEILKSQLNELTQTYEETSQEIRAQVEAQQ